MKIKANYEKAYDKLFNQTVDDASEPSMYIISLRNAIRLSNKQAFFKLIGDPQTELEKKLAQAYWTEAQTVKNYIEYIKKNIEKNPKL